MPGTTRAAHTPETPTARSCLHTRPIVQKAPTASTQGANRDYSRTPLWHQLQLWAVTLQAPAVSVDISASDDDLHPPPSTFDVAEVTRPGRVRAARWTPGLARSDHRDRRS